MINKYLPSFRFRRTHVRAVLLVVFSVSCSLSRSQRLGLGLLCSLRWFGLFELSRQSRTVASCAFLAGAVRRARSA